MSVRAGTVAWLKIEWLKVNKLKRLILSYAPTDRKSASDPMQIEAGGERRLFVISRSFGQIPVSESAIAVVN